MSIIWVNKNEIRSKVARKIIATDVVLDVGSGISPQSFFRPRVHICLDPYIPYLERVQKNVRYHPRYILINCTWDVLMKRLLPKSVDSVFALDFIEHLSKSEGIEFLREAERIARRQIVIYTPLGFYPQNYDENDSVDRWGMRGGRWQSHRSGWAVEDFGDSWELICCKEYHYVDQNEQPLEKPFGAIWGFRNIRNENELQSGGIWCIKALLQRITGNFRHFTRMSSR